MKSNVVKMCYIGVAGHLGTEYHILLSILTCPDALAKATATYAT